MVLSSIHVPQPGHAWPSQVTPGNEFVSPNKPMHALKDNGDHSKGTMTQTGALLEGTLSSMTKQPRVLRTFLGCRYRRGAAVCPRLIIISSDVEMKGIKREQQDYEGKGL